MRKAGLGKTQLLPSLTGLHAGTCSQLGQVVEATGSQKKVVGEKSHPRAEPPRKKIRTGF